jgi:hypothetical protein
MKSGTEFLVYECIQDIRKLLSINLFAEDEQMTDNPFTDCRVEKYAQEQWGIASNFWRIPCTSEKDAARLCEIIRGAYRAGTDDLRRQFNALLTDNDE